VSSYLFLKYNHTQRRIIRTQIINHNHSTYNKPINKQKLVRKVRCKAGKTTSTSHHRNDSASSFSLLILRFSVFSFYLFIKISGILICLKQGHEGQMTFVKFSLCLILTTASWSTFRFFRTLASKHNRGSRLVFLLFVPNGVGRDILCVFSNL